ncbi:MAG TPA: MarR family winged helix-turn-helix transcriptional regulator [Chloroflexota bacterium]|nr:MarR family winged helix-turn-helix transcriptional regulator [Chloroflexota bacterium]
MSPRVPTRTPGLLAWLRLVRVYHKLQRAEAGRLRCWGLSPAQFDVLAHVGAAEGLSQQRLADALLVTKGNICQILDKMERDGLIQRQPVGRVNQVYLTEAGRQLEAEVVPGHERFMADQLAVLCAAEQLQLHQLLRALDRALGNTPANGLV